MTKQEKGRGRFGDVLKGHTNFEGKQTVSIVELMFRNLEREKCKKKYFARRSTLQPWQEPFPLCW